MDTFTFSSGTLLSVLTACFVVLLVYRVSNMLGKPNSSSYVKSTLKKMLKWTGLLSRDGNESDDGMDSDDDFDITIPRMQYNAIEKFVRYQIVIKRGDHEWETWRRYSEFRLFYKRHEFKPNRFKFPPKSTPYQILLGESSF